VTISKLAPMCSEVRDDLTAMDDGELLSERAGSIADHLATCRECSLSRAAMRSALDALSASPLHGGADQIDVSEAVLRAIAMESRAPISLTAGAAPLLPLVQAAFDDCAARAADYVPTIDLGRHRPEPDAVAVIPANIARQFAALPIHKYGRTLFVAMESPGDIVAVDAIKIASRCLVRPMQALPGQLPSALNAAYPPEPPTEIQQLIDEVRALRSGIATLHAEMADLRRQIATVRGSVATIPPRPSARLLFPFAPAADRPMQ
jgi:hypothetical protein